MIYKEPYLTIEPRVWSDSSQVTPNKMELEVQKYSVLITYINPNNNTEQILDSTYYENITVISMDDNIYVDTNDEIGLEEINLIAIREGSAIVKAYYTNDDGDVIYGETEIVVYTGWFRDNYWQLIGEHEYTAIGGAETYMDCLLKACMEMYDILWAYNKDVSDLTDPLFAKSKFINVIGKSRGFVQTDFSTAKLSTEYVATQLYREVLSNLYELLDIRGTKLAYEMFFGALGYDIELLEFWYNEDGQLIEINPYDDEVDNLSSYSTYNINGRLIDSDGSYASDPRLNVSSSASPKVNNKSYFIKPTLTAKDGFDFGDLGGYSIAQKQIITQYLQFLKPLHMEYLDTVYDFNVNSINYYDSDDELNSELLLTLYDEESEDLLNPLFNTVNLLLPRYDTSLETPADIRPVYYVQTNAATIRYLPYNYVTTNKKLDKGFDDITQDGGGIDFTDLNNIITDDENFATINLLDTELSSAINIKTITDVDESLIYTLNQYGSQASRISYTIKMSTDATEEIIVYVRNKMNGDWVEVDDKNIQGWTDKTSYKFEGTFETLISWELLGNSTELEIKIKNNSGSSANINIYYAEANIVYYDCDRLGRAIPADPGGLEYTGEVNKGTWHRDTTVDDVIEYEQSGGGMCVETLWRWSNISSNKNAWQDSLIVSTYFYIEDTIATYETYDSANGKKYDEVGFYYDTGYHLTEASVPDGADESRTVGIIPINIKTFQTEYNNVSGSAAVKLAAMLANPKYIGITETTCLYIVNYTL